MFTGEIPWWQAAFFFGLGLALHVLIHKIIEYKKSHGDRND